jgi:DNA-binding MarR family transcriptional regulator
MPARSPRSPELAARIWAAMQTLVSDNHRQGDLRDALGLGLGSGRVKALFRLEDGPMTLSELAEAHGVDAPYATIIVDKLESLGLVIRTPHPSDGRRKLVTLTPAGREAAAFAHQAYRQPPKQLADLSVEDLQQLDLLLSRLA